MEDNNSFLIKTIAGALILILALNVYRTESTKKQMDRLAARIDSLSVRMDAMEYPDFTDIGSGAVQNVDNKTVDLAKGLTQLQAKVTTLQGKVDNISSNPSDGSKGTAASAASSKDVSDLAKSVSDLQSKVNSLQKTVDRLSDGQQRQASSNQGSSISTIPAQPSSGSGQSYGRVTVTSKVKVEDRYVNGKAPMPSVTTGPTGIVVVGVTMDQIGIVSKATVNSGTTISDEDVLDACKEAALKTSFGYNPDAPNHSVGTITYTFTAR